MRFNKTIQLLALCGLMLCSINAMAIQYVDSNPANVRLDANPTARVFGFTVTNALYNPSYTGLWDLLNEGYNPTTQTISSAVATFRLNDANGGSESYSITIDGTSFLNGGSFSTPLLGTISMGSSVTGSALLTLDDTGLLSYTVTANSGVFWLANAELVAEAEDRVLPAAASVPDAGTTAAMLGMGLLGIFGCRRKLER